MTKTWVVGLKLALIEIILGVVSWLLSLLLALVGIFAQASAVFWILILIILLVFNIFFGGWLANKIWKWR